MMRSKSVNRLCGMIMSFLMVIPAFSQQPLDPDQKGYAPVNSLNLYYEIYGKGDPVVLLHGSYMTIGMNWGELIPELAKTQQVIALEMHGHGRTNMTDAPFSYASFSNDVAGLMQHLKIPKADVIGYSLGGTVAFDFAIRYPDMVDRLVIISSVFKLDGWHEAAIEVFPMITPEFLAQTPLKTEYDRLSPHPEKWTAFAKKMIAFDTVYFDLGKENIANIKSPVLIISGDNDGVDLDHLAEMYRLVGGAVFADMVGLPKSRLAIIPGQSHVSLMMQTEALMDVISPFLME